MGIVKRRKMRFFDRMGKRQFRLYIKPKEVEWLKENYPDATVEVYKSVGRYDPWQSHVIKFTEIEHAIHFEAEFIKSHERRS